MFCSIKTDAHKLIILVLLSISIPSVALDPDFTLKTPQGTMAAAEFSGYYYASFDFEEPCNLELNSKFIINRIEISPRRNHLPVDLITPRKAHFTIAKPGQYMVGINDSVRVFIFADSAKRTDNSRLINILTNYRIDNTGRSNQTDLIQQALNEISGTGKILCFPPGIYKSSQLYIRSNSRIFLSRGAVLFADTVSVRPFFPTDNVENRRFIYLNNVENVEISGSGEINGNGNYLRSKYGDDARIRLLLGVRSSNILIEGITLKDPGSWNTHLILCKNVVIRNVKLLNNIDLSNTDGFDPDGSDNILIENSFAYCGDDNVAVKATGRPGLTADVNKITVRGCVFLTKKSSLKVGTETRTEIMKNIIFEDNDVIECDRGMAIYVRDGASLDTIIFRNNRFERNYPDAQKKIIHFEVDRRDAKSKLGRVNYVLIKDCIVDDLFPSESVIKCEDDQPGINVTIDNLVIAGNKVVDPESARLKVNNSRIIFR